MWKTFIPSFLFLTGHNLNPEMILLIIYSNFLDDFQVYICCNPELWIANTMRIHDPNCANLKKNTSRIPKIIIRIRGTV